MLVICLLNNIVLRGRGFCTSSIAQITGNVPRLLADIVAFDEKLTIILNENSRPAETETTFYPSKLGPRT